MNEVLTLQMPFCEVEYSFMFQLEDKVSKNNYFFLNCFINLFDKDFGRC